MLKNYKNLTYDFIKKKVIRSFLYKLFLKFIINYAELLVDLYFQSKALQIYNIFEQDKVKDLKNMKHGTNGMRAADSLSSGEGIMDGWRMSLSASVSILLVYRDTGLLRHVLFQVLPFLLRALDLVEPLGDLEARPAVDFALK